MRTRICGNLLILLFLCSNVFADASIQKVEIAPLTGGVSFNTVTFGYYTGWVTCPSVEMIGRKELIIINTSTANNLYLTGVSGSTVTGTLGPKEYVTFKSASNLHIYASGSSVTMECWEIR